MKKFLLAFVCLFSLFLVGCYTDPDGARRVLQQNGYTNIEITGYRYGMGGEDDTYVTGFRARSPNGQTVTGAVTRGLYLKGSTIRFD